jgi:hypothetical protein
MKGMLTLLTAAVFTFTFGTVFADDMPLTRGIEPGAYYGVVTADDQLGVTGAAPGGVREEEIEKSTMIWESLFGPENGETYAQHETGIKGAAPGGVREAEIEKSTMVFESLFGSDPGL